MSEETVTVIVNPLVPLQENQKESSVLAYKFKRFRQDPPWGAIFCCSGCLAFGISLFVILILNVKEFSMD